MHAATLGLVAALASGGEPSSRPPEGTRTLQQWGAITMFHGLPSPNVRAIVQDKDGILWFGTDAGLARYDGQRLERAPLGGPTLGVRALAVGPEGSLWVGTDAGAFVRRAGDFAVVPGTGDQTINAILAAPDGSVYLASERGIVFTCSFADGPMRVASLGPEQSSLLRDRGQAPLAIVALARRESTLLLGTRSRGLLLLDAGLVHEITDPARPFFLTAIANGEAGRIFLGADTSAAGRGAFALDGDRAAAFDVRSGPVSSLAVDGSGDLWVGTRDRGLFQVHDGRATENVTFESSGGGLHSNHILAVFADRDGVLWIGTDRGVCRYDPRGPRAEHLGTSSRSNFIHALLPAKDGRLWAGTQSGLFVRRDVRGAWEPVAALGQHVVHALAETEDGRLIAGTATGLYATAGKEDGWEVIRPQRSVTGQLDSVRAVRNLGGATYLAVFGGGLEQLLGNERVILWPAPDDDPSWREVLSLSVVDDALWMGTARAGVFAFRGGRVTRDADLSALGTLWSAASDGEGGLWIGTDRGLFRRAKDRIEMVAPGHDVRALLPADGSSSSVWCATTGSGILKVAVASPVGVVTSRLGTDYGLPSDSVYAMATLPDPARGARLVLGTNRGVAFYEPGHVAPGLRFVRVLGRRLHAPDEWSSLHLDYPENSLLVETAAIGTRTYPEHFQYLFSLATSGSGNVRSLLSRDGQFATGLLTAGRYCLEARALSVDLRASAPVSLCFEVARAPLPWGSISLGGLLVCALLALVWGYRQNRRLVGANLALAETRLQLVQETENERRRIARDLHDQTLADLRRLLLMAPPFRETIESISTDVRRICEDLSPSVLQNVGLAAALEWALEESVRHLPAERTCKTTFSCPTDVEERLSVAGSIEIQIYRMVREALSNVARHALATQVRLAVGVLGDGALEISVADDGRGFDLHATASGRGLANIRSRASLIGAEVDWSARPGGGTVFRLRMAGRVR